MQPPPSKGRVFLVSHNFPPTLGPESSLVRLNTIDLCERGWRVSVLTTTTIHSNQQLDLALLEGLPVTLEILRTPSYDAVLKNRCPKLSRWIFPVLQRWVLPEIFLFWLFSAVPAGKRWLSTNAPAVIYSRATKNVSNVSAWFLKRATGLPWVAHISDPWVGDPLNWFQRWFARRLEARVFRDADAIVIVSEKLAIYILRLYPWAKHKVKVIPHGYAPLTTAPQPVVDVGHRPLTALQAGSFLPGYREPDKLFAGLALLNKRSPLAGRIRLIFVGEDTIRYQSLANELGLSQIIDLRASVPYNECQRMIDQSDLLLVLDTPHSGGIYLPTKLIEYLPYSKPILGLAEADSTIHQVLKECDLDFADQNSPKDIAEAFERLLIRWESGVWGVSSESIKASLKYRIDRVNAQLDDILESLTLK